MANQLKIYLNSVQILELRNFTIMLLYFSMNGLQMANPKMLKE